MKLFLLLTLALTAFAVQAQKPVFKPLTDPRMSAGCFAENSKHQVLINMVNDGEIFVNFTGTDLTLTAIKKIRGYGQAYGNSVYKVYISGRFIKKGEGCLEDHRFKVRVMFKGRAYDYSFKGFCGC